MPKSINLRRFYETVIKAGFDVFRLNTGGSNRPFPVPKGVPRAWKDAPRIRGAISADRAIKAISDNENLAIAVRKEGDDLLILDCDEMEQEENLRTILDKADCRTLEAHTPRGTHFFFAGNVPPVIHKNEKTPLFDIRRSGESTGYVVGPGSFRNISDYTEQKKAPPDAFGGPWYYTPHPIVPVARVPDALRAALESPSPADAGDPPEAGDPIDEDAPELSGDDFEAGPDGRHRFLLRLIWRMVKKGISAPEVRRAAFLVNSRIRKGTTRAPLPEEDVQDLLARSEKKDARMFPNRKRRGVLYERDETVLISAANRLDALCPDPGTFRYNERSAAVERRAPGDDEAWLQLDDFFDPLRAAIHRHTFTMPSPGRRKKDRTGNYGPPSVSGLKRKPDAAETHLRAAVITRALSNRVDPFAAWLNRLPPWDKTPRILDTIPATFAVAAEDTELAGQALRSVLCGVVRRAISPGCQHDTVVVLVGPEGSGKDTLWRSLLPDLPGCRLYSGSLHWDAPTKDQIEICLGKAIVHASDSPGLKRADQDRLKTFITETVDRSRLSYRRDAADFPRRFVIVASTNRDRFVPIDGTGEGRRWIPVPVRMKHALGPDCRQAIIAFTGEHRVQLWAEAVALVKEGHWGEITGKAETRRLMLLGRLRARSHAEDEIEDYIRSIPDAGSWSPPNDPGISYPVDDGLSLSELGILCNCAGLSEPPMKWGNFLPRVLRNAGWELRQQRVRGRKGRYWFPPV